MKLKLNQNKNFLIEVSHDELEDLYIDLDCINQGLLPFVSEGKYTDFLKKIQMILKEVQLELK